MDWLTYWNIYNFFKRRKKAPKVAIEQYDIAENYLYGRGVTQNYEKAADWFRLSARQNYAPAQNDLGFLYLKGLGVPQSYPEAIDWFHLSANQGWGRAQHNIGYMHYTGDGVTKNYRLALKWSVIITSISVVCSGNLVCASHPMRQKIIAMR